MKVWKYDQDNINTDMLFPGKYTYSCSTPEEIKPHLLEDLDPNFSENVEKGDVIFAGKNFGCGSSREQPVVGLRYVGIKAVVAKSYARIFYRAAINQGLILIECPDALSSYKEGDKVEINLEKGELKIGDNIFLFTKLPKKILEIREAGGLLNYTRNKLKENEQ